jgi:hypothetical protein
MSLIVVVTNITQLADISDYNYQVLVGDGTPERSKTIAMGQIKGHERAKGWKTLVQRIVDEAEGD